MQHFVRLLGAVNAALRRCECSLHDPVCDTARDDLLVDQMREVRTRATGYSLYQSNLMQVPPASGIPPRK